LIRFQSYDARGYDVVHLVFQEKAGMSTTHRAARTPARTS